MKLSSYWRLIRENRNFRLIWLAQIVSETGDWFYSVAVFSVLLQLTGSAQMVSFAFMTQVLPQCFLAPAAGAINDRLSRKRLMIFADWARAAIVLSMMFVQSRETVWLLFVLLFLETACWSIFEPGQRATIPNIVREADTPAANALVSATWSVNFALGAAIGGFVAVAFGRNTVFVIDSLSFVASALLISRTRFSEPHAENLPPFKLRELFDFTPIVEGARYMAKDRKRFAAVFVKGGTGIMGSNWVVLPVLGARIFPVQLHGLSADQSATLGMSTLLASRGVGALLGSYIGGNIAGLDLNRIRWIIFAGFLMSAIGYMSLGGIAWSLGAAVASLIVAHMGGSSTWTASTTLLQQQTEDRFRGRVFSAEFAFMMLMLSVSSFVAGRLVDSGVDVRSVAFGTGVAMLLPAAVWYMAADARR
jgi:MFS family permease